MTLLPIRRSMRIFLPCLLLLAGLLGSRPAVAQGVEPVFGLRGVLRPVSGEPFATLLVDPAGNRYGIVGATPAIEQTLTDLATQEAAVRVWGNVQRQNPLSQTPLIVATNVLPDVNPPAATPVGTPTPRPTPTPIPPLATRPAALPMPTTAPVSINAPLATIAVYAAYLRAGPGSDYPTIGQVSQGVACAVAARAVMGGWLKLQCPGLLGWMRADLVEVSGSLAGVPLETGPTPTPVPSPTPLPGAWRVLGYANRDLSAPPAATFETSEINYDWGLASPSPVLPPDNFSMRFDRTLRFTPGAYQFALTYDDGVRLYVSNQLVINDWAEGAARTRTWQGALSGDVAVRVDYFDAFGQAVVRLAITPLQGTLPTPTPLPPVLPAQPPDNAWLATYFNTTTPQGPPVFARTEPAGATYALDYDFGASSPVPGVISPDGWSARWRGRFRFDSADYRFYARGNEGVRVYIDGIRVLDAWPNVVDTVSNTFRQVGGGWHEMAVEMYDEAGPAWVRVWWERLPTPPGPQIAP